MDEEGQLCLSGMKNGETDGEKGEGRKGVQAHLSIRPKSLRCTPPELYSSTNNPV